MFTVRSVLSKSVFNACRKFTALLTSRQAENLREMTLGMLLGNTSHLSAIGGVMASEVTPRKSTERYARTLEKMDTDACHRQHIACVSEQFRSEPVLILWDGGDIQKRWAREMAYVCPTIDGSEGHTVGRGYPTFAAIAYGLRSNRQAVLCHHLYSTVDPAFQSVAREKEKCFDWMSPLFMHAEDRIVVSDRGDDDEKHFLFCLQELRCSFLTRINTAEKKSRNLHLVRGGDITDVSLSVWKIAEQMQGAAGASKAWKNNKIRKMLTSRIAYQEVRLPDYPEIPLFLVLLYTDGFTEPMVLLTDIAIADAQEAWDAFFWYKKRWEVENFFRAIKQEFSAERFLIRSFPAIRALAFVMMLAFWLLREIRSQATEIFATILQAFLTFCRKWQRKKESHIDLLHWMREEWQRSPYTGVISHRSWARHRCKVLRWKPGEPEVAYLPPGKW